MSDGRVHQDAARVAGSARVRSGYEFLLQAAIWPAMDRLNGTTIAAKQALLEESQWWSAPRLRELQSAKLTRLLRHAQSAVPHYQRVLRGVHAETLSAEPFGVLQSLPTVSKTELGIEPEAFLASGESMDRLVRGQTSGSTGQPTRFYRSREQESWHWALKFRMWGMAGYRLGHPCITLYNRPRTTYQKRIQDFLLRNRALYLFAGADQSRVVERFAKGLPGVRFVAGCTSSIKIVCEELRARGLTPVARLSAILTTGSLLTAGDRRFIEETLGAPVWDHYGLGGEGAHVAAECEEKNGYHVNCENVMAEPSDPTAVDSGRATEVLLTVLDNLAWPLIRYRTGDFAIFTSRSCSCRRGLPLLERIEGRVGEIITLSNGVRLNTHYFSSLVSGIDSIAEFRVVEMGQDDLCYELMWRFGKPDPGALRTIEQSIATMSGGRATVRFREVEGFPLTASGKHRYVVPQAS